MEEIKTFLTDSANLPWSVTYPDHRDHFKRWLLRWQRLFTYSTEVGLPPRTDEPRLEEILNGDVDEDGDVEVDRGNDSKWERVQIPREELELFAPVVRTTLCRLWTEQDPRQRDWYLYRLRDAHRQMVRHLEGWDERAIWCGAETVQRLLDYALQEVPRITPFEAAIYWLQRDHALMLRCANPLCVTPYFFRPEKAKRQKHCSPECAGPARKQAKLKWWNENRKNQRKKK